MMDSVAHQIAQLELARQVVLADSVHYSTITPGILPIIGANAPLEIRRWGADFLAEGFASPSLSLQAKEALGVQALQTFNELLDSAGEDSAVVKSVIQAAASIYGLVFRYTYVTLLTISSLCRHVTLCVARYCDSHSGCCPKYPTNAF